MNGSENSGIRAPWRAWLLAVLLGAFAVLQGCTSSPWEQNFVATAEAPPLANNAPVQLREVQWDRVQAGLREIEAKEAATDVHPEDWPPEKKAAVKGSLLRTLQVSEDPSKVEIVGRSTFRTTTPLSPESDRDLVTLARKVGADRVVWTRSLMGRADRIVQEPVTTFGTSFGTGWGHRRGPSTAFTQTSTTWVPVVVQADEIAYVAYFLRMNAH
jgi:hypothetical protein